VYSASTTSTTATATGGTPPYTYSWVNYSGTTFGINGNTTATAYCVYGGAANTYNSTILCTATDSLGNKGYVTVAATIILSQ
jgi:hypothetical protein